MGEPERKKKSKTFSIRRRLRRCLGGLRGTERKDDRSPSCSGLNGNQPNAVCPPPSTPGTNDCKGKRVISRKTTANRDKTKDDWILVKQRGESGRSDRERQKDADLRKRREEDANQGRGRGGAEKASAYESGGKRRKKAEKGCAHRARQRRPQQEERCSCGKKKGERLLAYHEKIDEKCQKNHTTTPLTGNEKSIFETNN